MQIEENKKLQEQATTLQEQVMVQEKVEMEEQQTSLEAELSVEAIQGDRSEEDRLTEAEKNERQRKMLQVCGQILKSNHLIIDHFTVVAQ